MDTRIIRQGLDSIAGYWFNPANDKDVPMHPLIRHLLGLVFVIGLFMGSLLASWHVLSAFDFFYGLHYDILNVDESVAKFVPKNRYPDKRRFLRTDRPERLRMFSAIVHGINNDGEGLKELYYRSPSGTPLGMFLTNAERIHLEDVARLVSILERIAVAMLAAGVISLGVLMAARQPAIGLPGAALGLAGAMALVILIVMLIGPTAVFYRLHIAVFPGDHQWFFYYQESLMTTIMRAPALFGWIATELGLIAAAFFTAAVTAVNRLVRRFSPA